jgi:preprotein translocase subunit SecE
MSRVTEFSEDDAKQREEDRQPNEAEGGVRPLSLPALGWTRRIGAFYHDTKLEMRKTSWPTRSEVWSTTLVVLIAIVFFGFYLWGVDRLVALGFEFLEKTVR